jgi:N-acetylglutamate synthase-like GNAT family acetyltransferase
MRIRFKIRAATEADIPALQRLIARSGVKLSAGFYTPVQDLCLSLAGGQVAVPLTLTRKAVG